MARQASFIVTLDLPPGATPGDARFYIRREVMAGCGGLDPDRDPMAHLDRDSVKVAHAGGTLAAGAEPPPPSGDGDNDRLRTEMRRVIAEREDARKALSDLLAARDPTFSGPAWTAAAAVFDPQRSDRGGTG